jgi:two-component system phosphate regulon sensor histidine kinase PhoR
MTVTNSTARETQLSPMRSEKVLHKILETSRAGVIVVGRDTRISVANAAAQIAFSRQGESIEHKRLSEVIRDLSLHEAFSRALSEGISTDLRLEYTVGNRSKYDVHVSPIELDGAIVSIGFFYDTTRIERLETVRQEFLSNISHELRTPLTSIITFVETLEDGGIDDDENKMHFLSVIKRNAERMHSLIADILELSMIESGNVSVNIRDIKPASLVNEVLSSLSSKAETREVRLINQIPDGAVIFADSVRLEQMITNLIDNAIKFNRRGGTVTVSYEQLGEKDVISVTDTGEGIIPDHLPRIFERFYRTDRARSRDLGGTGLGLAIVKHLAKLHGGEVFVESEMTRGTTFRIEFPAK